MIDATGPFAVIVDDTALEALGAGNQTMSRLVVAAHSHPDQYLLAPTMCIAAAVSRRPELADHIGGLLAVHALDLTFAGAAGSADAIIQGTAWEKAHAVTAAQPSAEWPSGLPVVTTTPRTYAAHGLRTIPLTKG